MSLCVARSGASVVMQRIVEQWSAFTDLFPPILALHTPKLQTKLHNPASGSFGSDGICISTLQLTETICIDVDNNNKKKDLATRYQFM